MARAGSSQPSARRGRRRARVVTARQHGHAGAAAHGLAEHAVGERPARVARHHHVAGADRRRSRRRRARTRPGRAASATRRQAPRAAPRPTAESQCPRRAPRATSRRGATAPARGGHAHRRDRRCGRRGTAAAHAAPAPTPRRALCAAGIPRRRRREQPRRTATRRRSVRGRAPSAGSWRRAKSAAAPAPRS